MNKITISIIQLLADGEFHSGESIGLQYGISRVAINKHIQLIRGWGLDVYSVTGKGYRLSAPLKLLDETYLQQHLSKQIIEVLFVTDSTNQYLLDRVHQLQTGHACVAEYQTSGRGRRGKQWYSPFGSNIYLSLYWRLKQGAAAAIGLSLVVGVVVAEVLNEFCHGLVKLKWPNDIYVHNRKLGGVLVELCRNIGNEADAVIGVGINLFMYSSDPTVVTQSWINFRDVVEQEIDRNQLIIHLVNSLRKNLAEFEQKGFAPFQQRWMALDNFIEQPVNLMMANKIISGVYRGIDQQGALLLANEQGITPYIGGEISMRPQLPTTK